VAARNAAEEVRMYVVAGVSGRTGSVVADTLLRAGRSVRVIVRDPAKGALWATRGATVAVASLQDEHSLGRALTGAEGAYLLSPQDMRSADPISDGWRIADAIARAVQQAGVPHLVLLSALGAQHAEGTGLPRTLHAAEERLAASPARITFLRAAYFLDNWAPALAATAGGKLPTFVAPDRVVPMVATADIGRAAATALLEGPPRRPRDLVELSGPRDYSPRDLAAALAQLLQRPVEPQHMPLEGVVPFLTSLGASTAFAEQVRLLYQAIEEGRVTGQGEDVRSVRGSTDAETFLRETLAGGRAS
jgi:NAD(P)H dehydrogenase (quinone)